MTPRTKPWFVFGVLLSFASFGLVGCADGDITHRDDGKVATTLGGQRESPLTDIQVKERAAQLLKDHPGMSAKEAFKQARADVAPTYDPPMLTREEIEKAEAQDKFEEQLAKLEK